MSLYDYIREMSSTILEEKSREFQALLTINPGQDRGLAIANFENPSDIDLYALPEKFHAVVRAYLKVMRSIYIASDLKSSFVDLNELLVCLNRAAETQSNWICPALINCSEELISVYQVRMKQFPSEDGSVIEPNEFSIEIHRDSPLEVVANTINKSFKICLTDKTLELSLSKKKSIHFFLAALMKIYFKLDKLELAKSVEKALAATGYPFPTIKKTPIHYRKYVVSYLYFSALLSLNDSDFVSAEKKLCTAMEFLSHYKNPVAVCKQTEMMLMLLVPLKMNNSRTTLKAKKWNKYPSLKFVFKDRLFPALKSGNLRLFDHWTRVFQKIFLKRYLYILILHLRNLCILRLFQRTHKLYSEIISTTPHIVPFSAFQLALLFSRSYDPRPQKDSKLVHLGAAGSALSSDLDTVQLPHVDYGEIECLLANFILKRLIKGYLSHSNKCIVLSKTEPFPVSL